MIPGSLETDSGNLLTSTKPAPRGASRLTHVGRTSFTVLHQVLRTLSTWRTRAAERQRLSMLGDHLLRDIGLNRADVHREVSKPFWCE
jgi:uncharacterized protein YjiS (DUF1127 family)